MLKTCIRCGRTFKGNRKSPNLCPRCLREVYLESVSERKKKKERENIKRSPK